MSEILHQKFLVFPASLRQAQGIIASMHDERQLVRNNILIALAGYAEKTGRDPRPYLRKAAELIETTLAKSSSPLPLWNDLCASLCELARHENLYGQDSSQTLKRGHTACQHAITVSPEFHVGYLNQACLHLESGRADLLKGKPVDIGPGLESLKAATQRRTDDSDSLANRIALHILDAYSRFAHKQPATDALQEASVLVSKHRKMFPEILASYLMASEFLRAKVEIAKDSVTETEIQAGLALLEEGMKRFPGDPDLRFNKAVLLLFRAANGARKTARADLRTAVEIIESVRPILGHRKDFIAAQAQARAIHPAM